jgi:hypothetical protein
MDRGGIRAPHVRAKAACHHHVPRCTGLPWLFMTFETNAPTHVQTAWYSNSVRVARRKAPRGLNTNVW